MNEAEVIADLKKLVEASERSEDFKRIAKAVIAEMLQYHARQNKVEAKTGEACGYWAAPSSFS